MKKLWLLEGNVEAGLFRRLVEKTGGQPLALKKTTFPDGECQVELQTPVSFDDVCIVHSLSAPVGENLLQLQLYVDVLRRQNARRIVVVVPYLGYARQDRRVSGHEALGAKVVAETLSRHVDRVVVVDLHSAAVEGFFDCPVVQVSAEPVLCRALENDCQHSVVVSPDLGAVKLAERYAQALKLPMAVVHKHRISGLEVSAYGVVGNVQGLRPILVDDMISTAGTMLSATSALMQAGCVPEFRLVATHGLFVGPALERLAQIPKLSLWVSDTLPAPTDFKVSWKVVSVAEELAKQL